MKNSKVKKSMCSHACAEMGPLYPVCIICCILLDILDVNNYTDFGVDLDLRLAEV